MSNTLANHIDQVAFQIPLTYNHLLEFFVKIPKKERVIRYAICYHSTVKESINFYWEKGAHLIEMYILWT